MAALRALNPSPDERLRRAAREGDKLAAAIESLRAGIPIEPDRVQKMPFSRSFRAEFDFWPTLRSFALNWTPEGAGTQLSIEMRDRLLLWPDSPMSYEGRWWQHMYLDGHSQTPWREPRVMEVIFHALTAEPIKLGYGARAYEEWREAHEAEGNPAHWESLPERQRVKLRAKSDRELKHVLERDYPVEARWGGAGGERVMVLGPANFFEPYASHPARGKPGLADATWLLIEWLTGGHAGKQALVSVNALYEPSGQRWHTPLPPKRRKAFTNRPRDNPDEPMRDLERRAALGDLAARAQLDAAILRSPRTVEEAAWAEAEAARLDWIAGELQRGDYQAARDKWRFAAKATGKKYGKLPWLVMDHEPAKAVLSKFEEITGRKYDGRSGKSPRLSQYHSNQVIEAWLRARGYSPWPSPGRFGSWIVENTWSKGDMDSGHVAWSFREGAAHKQRISHPSFVGFVGRQDTSTPIEFARVLLKHAARAYDVKAMNNPDEPLRRGERESGQIDWRARFRAGLFDPTEHGQDQDGMHWANWHRLAGAFRTGPSRLHPGHWLIKLRWEPSQGEDFYIPPPIQLPDWWNHPLVQARLAWLAGAGPRPGVYLSLGRPNPPWPVDLDAEIEAARDSRTGAIVVLVSCAAEKSHLRSRARDLYTSDLFVKAREFVEALSEREEAAGRPSVKWAILSAKHGLLGPNQYCLPYDLRLEQLNSDQRCLWRDNVAFDLGTMFPNQAKFMVLAGGLYEKLLRGKIAIHNPLKGLGVGHRKQWLKEAARALRGQ